MVFIVVLLMTLSQLEVVVVAVEAGAAGWRELETATYHHSL